MPNRQIRALYDDATITVYQAYGPSIASPAATDGRFGAGFEWALTHSAFAHFDSTLHADDDTWRASLAVPRARADRHAHRDDCFR